MSDSLKFTSETALQDLFILVTAPVKVSLNLPILSPSARISCQLGLALTASVRFTTFFSIASCLLFNDKAMSTIEASG